ncbi:uncharacterized protein METZ01_LOCUS324580 [marine metagenome]|uniref:PurE domain-containing protein n=1 Tax=marine metagenome TaxID=408172 RepID=A0A382PES9_9ZZZZ
MGSDSDLPVMRGAAEIIEEFAVPFEMTIVSAHRTPELMFEYAGSAVDRGLVVIIAGAGGAAHLPGMVAALTVVPVVGVPVSATKSQGEDSLLSIAQMPKGVPVATVAIDNAVNAGLLSLQILATSDQGLQKKLQVYRDGLRDMVMSKIEGFETDWRSL